MKNSIVKPLITEKTMQASLSGWYTFQADISAQKNCVRKEIETLYGVTVVAIRSRIMHGKVRRVGRKGIAIQKSDWKKASVRLKSGQTIDAFQVGGENGQKK